MVLADIATVKAGYSFRGKIPEVDDGNTLAIQIKDLTEDGEIRWRNVISTNVNNPKPRDLLADGDIILAARGQRNLAAVVRKPNQPVVCAPHYFVISLKDFGRVLPDFLAWYLNLQSTQRYFQKSAEGSLHLSIRKSIVQSTPIMVPELSKQKIVVELHNAAVQEKHLLISLIENRRKQMQGIANDILGARN